jgi:hypothetical protein
MQMQPVRSVHSLSTLTLVEEELKRLGVSKHNVLVMLWFDFNGYIDWDRIDEPGLKHLLRFLQRCTP